MKHSCYRLGALVIAAVAAISGLAGQNRDMATATRDFEVRIVAHHWPTGMPSPTDLGLRNLLIAQVTGNGGTNDVELILLEYFHNPQEPPKIDELLSWKGSWLIEVVRNEECDANTSELIVHEERNADTGALTARIPAITIVPAGRGIRVPKDTDLKCYTIQTGNLRRVGDQR